MNTTLLVAPREIVDIVYRASRASGADSGAASLIGRSASFACCQLGANLSHITAALSQGRSPVLGIGHIAALEVQARQRGRGECLLESVNDRVIVADLAHAAFACFDRGIEITMVCGDGVEHSAHVWLSVGKADLQVVELRARASVMDDELRQRVQTRSLRAFRQGVSIPATTWKMLSDAASRYLVSESVIDAAEAP